MSMFRRPTDDSSSDSDSSTESGEEEAVQEIELSTAGTDHSNAGTEEIVGLESTTADTLSSGESISVNHSHGDSVVGDVEHVRDMMLASLLEDYYQTRAAELMNATKSSSNFNRQSPEIQSLARSLFAQASQALSSNGILPSTATSDDARNTRAQYIAGLDRFGLTNMKNDDTLFDSTRQRISASSNPLALVAAHPMFKAPVQSTAGQSIRDLALGRERMSFMSHPTNDLVLSSARPPHSHYKSSFQEMRLLGRGGFGRVYQTYNIFDSREYAIKKIPLSARLSQQYREKGHSELVSILREVQALARLDHCNVVRYHATWIEDPLHPYRLPEPSIFRHSISQQKLLTAKPDVPSHSDGRRHLVPTNTSFDISDGIKFEADSNDESQAEITHPDWTHNSHRPHIHQKESSTPDSDIFTDGMPHSLQSRSLQDDPSCYVLHVQMSMYPTTLAEYLSPADTARRSGFSASPRRHCFHLIPTIQILLGVLCGLQYIHARGLVHRDIKPSNIFLSSYDSSEYLFPVEGFYDVGTCHSCQHQQSYYINPRIGDFGLVADLAKNNGHCTGSSSSSGGIVGTEYYRPPIPSGKKPAAVVDEKLDIYALGVILVELLCKYNTNMERLKLLREVQNGVLPKEITAAIAKEGHSPEVAHQAKLCIKGMVERDQSLRWNGVQVKSQLEALLVTCHKELQAKD